MPYGRRIKKIQPPVKFQTHKPLIHKALEEIFEKTWNFVKGENVKK